MNYIRSTFCLPAIVSSLVRSSGCDMGVDRSLVDEPVAVVELGSGGRGSVEVMDHQSQVGVIEASDGSNDSGKIDIALTNGVLVVSPVVAATRDILSELSEVAGFEFSGNPAGLDKSVGFSEYRGSIEGFLKRVLDGETYMLGYADDSSKELPRLVSLHLGAVSKIVSWGDGNSSSTASKTLAGNTTDSEYQVLVFQGGDHGEITGADYSESADTDQLLAEIQEIDLNLTGLNTLEELYTSSPSAEVRREVVNTLADSDGFSSRKVILGALSDGSDDVVLAALEVIDIWQDPSVVPFVEPLTRRTDNVEISELAKEIVEFNSDEDATLVTRKSPEEVARSRLLTDANSQRARNRRDRQRIDRAVIYR